MKRPIGIIISVVVLAWLAVTGFINSWAILSDPAATISKSIGYFALLYAVAALFSVIGLWLMKQWGLLAIRCWMIACLLFLIVPEDMRTKMMQGGVAGMMGFFVFIIIVFWMFDRYIKSKLTTT